MLFAQKSLPDVVSDTFKKSATLHKIMVLPSLFALNSDISNSTEEKPSTANFEVLLPLLAFSFTVTFS